MLWWSAAGQSAATSETRVHPRISEAARPGCDGPDDVLVGRGAGRSVLSGLWFVKFWTRGNCPEFLRPPLGAHVWRREAAWRTWLPCKHLSVIRQGARMSQLAL